MKYYVHLLLTMCYTAPFIYWSQPKKTPLQTQQFVQQHDSTLLQLACEMQILEKERGKYLRSGAWDSAKVKANNYRDKGRIGYQSYEKIKANIAYMNGERQKSCNYVLKDVEYRLHINGGGGNPYDYIVDFNLCLPLVQDTFTRTYGACNS